MGAKSSLTMSWCTDQATVRSSKMRNLYDEAWEGLTGTFFSSCENSWTALFDPSKYHRGPVSKPRPSYRTIPSRSTITICIASAGVVLVSVISLAARYDFPLKLCNVKQHRLAFFVIQATVAVHEADHSFRGTHEVFDYRSHTL